VAWTTRTGFGFLLSRIGLIGLGRSMIKIKSNTFRLRQLVADEETKQLTVRLE
jgi:hypothetical protein